ncbi:DUF2911 domain-containing protein [Rudanella paleaurantiibacter]|nr:DUF2911 domain-containing protein [Rudanella paleaurantiibacter]
MPLKTRLLAILFLFITPDLRAQEKHKDTGYLIFTLGKDTTLIGHYQVNGDDFDMTVLVRLTSEVHKLKGTLFPTGECKSVEGYAYKTVPGTDSVLLQTYSLVTRSDSTFTEQRIGGNVSRFGYAGKGMLHLGIYPYVFFTPLMALRAPGKSGDSLRSAHFVYGTKYPFTLKRINKSTVAAGSPVMGMFTIYLDKKGKPNYIDAIGSSLNVKGRILSYLNLDSLIRSEAIRAQQYGVMPPLNKPDSVQATIGTTGIHIAYSRPSRRGRVIFGEVVPWNRFWRTGANAATKIRLSGPIFFADKELPAGEYSIFTIPSKNGWTLMFNKEANIWGTQYNPAHDVLRVPMQVEQVKEPVDLMTIEVVPVNGGGVIRVLWENTKASVAFTTRK